MRLASTRGAKPPLATIAYPPGYTLRALACIVACVPLAHKVLRAQNIHWNWNRTQIWFSSVLGRSPMKLIVLDAVVTRSLSEVG